MSFTKIGPVKVRDIKPRCHRCGHTKDVRATTMPLATIVAALCVRCRKVINVA